MEIKVRRSLLSVVLVMSVLAPALILSGPSASAANPPVKCQKVDKPIAAVDDVNLMKFRFCTGFVKTKDGVSKLDTSVTMPATGKGPFPLIVMLHGLTGSRKSNESDFVVGSGGRYHYNNLWFASKGYMVLSFTARGWRIFNTEGPISHSECQNRTPQSVDGIPNSMYPEADPACYIQISHIKYDVADTQYLVGRLVDGTLTNADGVEAAARKVGVTGVSLGGGQTWLLTRKNEWKSPKGTLIRVAAAAPLIGWTDIADALAPNGRRTDTETSLSLTAREAEPAGVKNDYVDVFYAGVKNQATDFSVTTSYLKEWKKEYDAGEPYTGDPVIEDAIHKLLKNRSAWFVKKKTDFDTPIFAVQGMTDGIFWANQSVRMYNRLNAEREAAGEARYPIRLYLGDWGHSPSQNKQAEFQYFVDLLNTWFRYHVKGESNKPPNTIDARMTICNGSDGALGPVYRGGDWAQLTNGPEYEFFESVPFTLTTPADDPHDQKLVPADGTREDQFNETEPDSQCRTTDTAIDDDNVAFETGPLVLGDGYRRMLGMPEITMDADPTGDEMYIAARLWDVDFGPTVADEDDTQTLVTRGVYRLDGTEPQSVSMELFGNGYEFPVGHAIKLELTADDSPSWQQWKHGDAGEIVLTNIDFTMPVARCENLLPECDD